MSPEASVDDGVYELLVVGITVNNDDELISSTATLSWTFTVKTLTATEITNSDTAKAPFNDPDLNDEDEFDAFEADAYTVALFDLGQLDDPNGDEVVVIDVTFSVSTGEYLDECFYVASQHFIECNPNPPATLLVRMEIEDVHDLDADKTQMVYTFPITFIDTDDTTTDGTTDTTTDGTTDTTTDGTTDTTTDGTTDTTIDGTTIIDTGDVSSEGFFIDDEGTSYETIVETFTDPTTGLETELVTVIATTEDGEVSV